MREKLIEAMESFKGAKTGNAKHKEIIDIYNSCKPLPRGVKMKESYPWCCATVSSAVIKAGLQDKIPRECSCGKLLNLMKEAGMWVESDSFVPTPGDFLIYDWGDSGKGDDGEGHDHIGMVKSVTGKQMIVMEGNKGGAWGTRKVSVNGKYIRGFCHLSVLDKEEKVYTKALLGEGLSKIAKRCGISLAQIKELNPDIKPPMYLVRLGKEVRIK